MKSPPMIVCESQRLHIRHITLADAAFLVQLFNQRSWLQNIGDRGVKSIEEAQLHIQSKMLEQYRTLGYGMYLVELKSTGEAVGLCGLVSRAHLPCPDLGFALLEVHWGKGYALEAAAAVMAHARQVLEIPQLVAITTLTNQRSGSVLTRLGFHLENEACLTPQGEKLRLYVAGSAAR